MERLPVALAERESRVEVGTAAPSPLLAEQKLWMERCQVILDPLRDGTFDVGDVEAITGAWLKEYASDELASAKREGGY